MLKLTLPTQKCYFTLILVWMVDNLEKGKNWFEQQGWTPFPFQVDTWQSLWSGQSGLVNAPTGSGKTYSLLVPIFLETNLKEFKNIGPKAIWITPIRALAQRD
jgi:ATP-dependent Lhr-like helicase